MTWSQQIQSPRPAAALVVSRDKVGLVVVRRRLGRGQHAPRLMVMTQAVFEAFSPMTVIGGPGMSQLLSVEEAAKRLAVTEAAIRKWVYQKRLPAVRVGRCLRLRLDDVERVASEGLE